jgi:hypothetical protein
VTVKSPPRCKKLSLFVTMLGTTFYISYPPAEAQLVDARLYTWRHDQAPAF